MRLFVLILVFLSSAIFAQQEQPRPEEFARVVNANASPGSIRIALDRLAYAKVNERSKFVPSLLHLMEGSDPVLRQGAFEQLMKWRFFKDKLAPVDPVMHRLLNLPELRPDLLKHFFSRVVTLGDALYLLQRVQLGGWRDLDTTRVVLDHFFAASKHVPEEAVEFAARVLERETDPLVRTAAVLALEARNISDPLRKRQDAARELLTVPTISSSDQKRLATILFRVSGLEDVVENVELGAHIWDPEARALLMSEMMKDAQRPLLPMGEMSRSEAEKRLKKVYFDKHSGVEAELIFRLLRHTGVTDPEFREALKKEGGSAPKALAVQPEVWEFRERPIPIAGPSEIGKRLSLLRHKINLSSNTPDATYIEAVADLLSHPSGRIRRRAFKEIQEVIRSSQSHFRISEGLQNTLNGLELFGPEHLGYSNDIRARMRPADEVLEDVGRLVAPEAIQAFRENLIRTRRAVDPKKMAAWARGLSNPISKFEAALALREASYSTSAPENESLSRELIVESLDSDLISTQQKMFGLDLIASPPVKNATRASSKEQNALQRSGAPELPLSVDPALRQAAHDRDQALVRSGFLNSATVLGLLKTKAKAQTLDQKDVEAKVDAILQRLDYQGFVPSSESRSDLDMMRAYVSFAGSTEAWPSLSIPRQALRIASQMPVSPKDLFRAVEGRLSVLNPDSEIAKEFQALEMEARRRIHADRARIKPPHRFTKPQKAVTKCASGFWNLVPKRMRLGLAVATLPVGGYLASVGVDRHLSTQLEKKNPETLYLSLADLDKLPQKEKHKVLMGVARELRHFFVEKEIAEEIDRAQDNFESNDDQNRGLWETAVNGTNLVAARALFDWVESQPEGIKKEMEGLLEQRGVARSSLGLSEEDFHKKFGKYRFSYHSQGDALIADLLQKKADCLKKHEGWESVRVDQLLYGTENTSYSSSSPAYGTQSYGGNNYYYPGNRSWWW